MSTFNQDLNITITDAKKLLALDNEWEERYFHYAEEISPNQDEIKTLKKNFHEWAPLYLYMNVSNAKKGLVFSLRYMGQDVAKLKVTGTKVTISTKRFDEKNDRDFNCGVQLIDKEWRSKEAAEFRKHFMRNPVRTDASGKKNREHRYESLLLTEFSKKKSNIKGLINIQPIKLAGIGRFQMPTPLSASNIKQLKYSKQYGGGIDILARYGIGRGTKLLVMEVKDEYETPNNVIRQGLVYAVFIQRLFRSKCGKDWWNIFGFRGDVPKNLDLGVACVMPHSDKGINDTSFGHKTIKNGHDSFHLHYFYFNEVSNKIMNVQTSL
jgi:hypothetical protein